MKSTVAIIGAGISGLILARELAKSGVEVTVYDQKKKLGYPVRASTILSASGMARLKIDHGKIPANELRGAIVHAGKKSMAVKARKPMAYSMDRHQFNEMLKGECDERGVQIEIGKRIDEKQLDKISNDAILVGADGFNSVVARHYGFSGSKEHILTYRAEYIADVDDTSMVELFFDKKMAPGFFGWIAPEPNKVVEIGIGIDSRSGNSKAAYDNFVRMPRVKDFIASAKLRDHGASVIPIGVRKHFADDKKEVLLVGDAAGQVKPTTGGGIIFGGNGAMIAADAIKRHIKNGYSLMEYEKLWRKKHGADIGMHSFVKGTYSRLSAEQIASLMGFFTLLRMDKFLGDYGDMDRPSLMLKRFFLRKFAN